MRKGPFNILFDVQTNRIPTQGLKRFGWAPPGGSALVQTNRIPTQGLKHRRRVGQMGLHLGPNKQNPDSGIETATDATDWAAQAESKQTESRLRD